MLGASYSGGSAESFLFGFGKPFSIGSFLASRRSFVGYDAAVNQEPACRALFDALERAAYWMIT